VRTAIRIILGLSLIAIGWSAVAAPAPRRLLLGAALPGGMASAQKITAFEARTGRHVDIAELPVPWANGNGFLSFAVSLPWVRAVAAHGGVPMITWEPEIGPSGAKLTTAPLPGACPGAIATAPESAPVIRYIARYAHDVATYGKPVLIRPMHEMNIPGWYWSIGKSSACGTITSRDFVAAWRRIVAIFRHQGADNARFVWCVNHVNLDEATFTSTFPGDDATDYVAIDGYNWGGAKWTSFRRIFTPAYQAVTRVSTRPVLIAEWASAEKGGNKAAWITDAFATLASGTFPRIVGLVWFDRRNPGQPDWPIDSSVASASAYRRAARKASSLGGL
jgi:Glycosyl hydrolase family 26